MELCVVYSLPSRLIDLFKKCPTPSARGKGCSFHRCCVALTESAARFFASLFCFSLASRFREGKARSEGEAGKTTPTPLVAMKRSETRARSESDEK